MNILNTPEAASSYSKPAQAPSGAVPIERPKVDFEAKSTKLTTREINDVVEQANKALEVSNSNLKFVVDPESGEAIVQVIDQETQTVLRQIPSVEMLKIAKAMEKMQGILISREA